MNWKLAFAVAGVVSVAVISGCNVGMQPEGPDINEVKRREAALPPDQQIKMIMSSPMKGDEKKARIAEIRQKYHLPADDASSSGGPGKTP